MANAWILAPLPIAGVLAVSGTSAGDAGYIANDYSGVVWKSASAAFSSFVVDLGSDQAVDTIMLFGVDGPPAATLKVDVATASQGAGFAAGNFVTSLAIPIFAGANRLASGKGVSIWSAAGAPLSGQYVRVTFALPAAGIVTVGRAVIGERIVLARNFTFGAGFGVRDLGSLDFSARGVLLRRRGAKLRTASVAFSNAYRDEVEGAIAPLVQVAGNTEPFALLTDPTPDPMIERRCYFGTLVGDLTFVQRNAVGWEWKPNIVSLF